MGVTSDLDSLTGMIIGAAIAVHREVGPGLLESAYEACLLHELDNRDFERSVNLLCPFTTREPTWIAGIDLIW